VVATGRAVYKYGKKVYTAVKSEVIVWGSKAGSGIRASIRGTIEYSGRVWTNTIELSAEGIRLGKKLFTSPAAIAGACGVELGRLQQAADSGDQTKFAEEGLLAIAACAPLLAIE
jgi:hypothetical protein